MIIYCSPISWGEKPLQTISRCAPRAPLIRLSSLPSELLSQYHIAAHACPPRPPRNQRFPSVVMSVNSGRIRLRGRLIRTETRWVGLGVGGGGWGGTPGSNVESSGNRNEEERTTTACRVQSIWIIPNLQRRETTKGRLSPMRQSGGEKKSTN